MKTLISARLGEVGYVTFVHELERLGVLDRDSVREHLRLHGHLLRMCEPPLDDGGRLDEQAFAKLERELGES